MIYASERIACGYDQEREWSLDYRMSLFGRCRSILLLAAFAVDFDVSGIVWILEGYSQMSMEYV